MTSFWFVKMGISVSLLSSIVSDPTPFSYLTVILPTAFEEAAVPVTCATVGAVVGA